MEAGESPMSNATDWEEKLKEIDNMADRLGMPIDEGIKAVVVGLNVLNIPTIASCEGHIDWGMNAPWVEIAAPDEPDSRFNGESEEYARLAAVNKARTDAKRREDWEVREEAQRRTWNNGETSEYEEWKKKNEVLRKNAATLLEEFYKNGDVSADMRLTIDRNDGYPFRIFNGGDDYRPFVENMSAEEQKRLATRLKAYQNEMNRFAMFMKNKHTH